MQNIRLIISYRYRKIGKKNEMLSLNYDVNDHVYSSQNPFNFERI